MNTLTRRQQLFGLAGWLLLAYLAATIGAVASVNAAEFYQTLQQPSWAPPAGAFGPVWTTLYALMGIAAWLVWCEKPVQNVRPALTLFVVQLAVNALWSWLYFVWNLGAISFAGTVILWCLILATLINFWRIKPLAGALLVPYLAWVTLATALTWSTWHLNPQMLG
ncbi:tryptophan-rich sensory protein [Kushneria pakistanensis]|uniref:Tryptophan-rich sensory protein n=1 Tax=Kushneria pakistanensis TaxID=1508770 RepID=A0ABQ3FPM9_9GAMM|nr:TspO/MBR family protein [Kushneria pakistanensis]GHC33125.1 tryptophan-rich sensory protein [Kushneria pakistanensis]